MNEHTYDAVVVGAGIGGLTTAALLARSGKKVAVVDDHERPGGHAHAIRDRGYTIDSALHLITQCGRTPFLGTGVVDAVLRHLGVRDRCELIPVSDPFYTACMPDGFRIAVPTGLEAYLAAHAEHFPDEVDALRKLMDTSIQIARERSEFPEQPRLTDLVLSRWRTPTLFRYRNATMQQVMDRELRDPHLKAVYAALAYWIGSPPWRASFVAWADMIAHYIVDGAYYCRGSFQALADAVTEALQRAGGVLVSGMCVDKIVAKDRRVQGIVLANGEQLTAPVVVSDVDARTTFERLVTQAEVPARLMRKLRRLEPTISAVAAYIATDLDVRSLGLGHVTTYSTTWDTRALYGFAQAGQVPALSLAIPTVTDPSLAPPGQHVMAIMALTSPSKPQAPEQADRVLDRAAELLPGLREHITAFIGPGPEQRAPLHAFGPIYGPAMTPSQVGAHRTAHETPIAGLFLVGQSTRPGAGVPAVIESGLQVARLLLGSSAVAALAPHRLVMEPAFGSSP